MIDSDNLDKVKCELIKQTVKLEALNDGVQEAIDVESLNDEIKQCTEFSMNTEERIFKACLLYTSPSPRDKRQSRMPSSA